MSDNPLIRFCEQIGITKEKREAVIAFIREMDKEKLSWDSRLLKIQKKDWTEKEKLFAMSVDTMHSTVIRSPLDIAEELSILSDQKLDPHYKIVDQVDLLFFSYKNKLKQLKKISIDFSGVLSFIKDKIKQYNNFIRHDASGIFNSLNTEKWAVNFIRDYLELNYYTELQPLFLQQLESPRITDIECIRRIIDRSRLLFAHRKALENLFPDRHIIEDALIVITGIFNYIEEMKEGTNGEVENKNL